MDNDLLDDVDTSVQSPSNEQEDIITDTASEEVVVEQSLKDFLKDEELKNDPSIDKFKSVDDVVKSYKALEKKLGSKIDTLSEEDLKALSSKFGVPKTIDEYEFEKDDNEIIGQIRNVLVKAGVSKKQAQDFDKTFRESIEIETKEEDYKHKLSLEEARNNLEREFGFAFKDKLMVAKETLKEIADDEAIAKFKEKGYTNDPDFIKALVKVGSIIGEDKLNFNAKTRHFNMTPLDIQNEIQGMIKEHGTSTIMKNEELKKRFVHLHTLKAEYNKARR